MIKIKYFVFIFCLSAFFLNASAQDTIALKMGTKIAGRVLKETDTIVYKPWGTRDSMIPYRLMSYDVKYIRHADGSVHSYEFRAALNGPQLIFKSGFVLSNLLGLSPGTLVTKGYSSSISYLSSGLGKRKKWKAEGGIAFAQKGGSIGGLSIIKPSGDNENVYDILRLNYLSADISIRFYPVPYFYFKAGCAMSYLQSYTLDAPFAFTQWNLPSYAGGMQTGFGFNSNGRKVTVLFEAVLQQDLNQMGISTAAQSSFRSGSVHINAGLCYNLSGK
jgi:hypothetical protein